MSIYDQDTAVTDVTKSVPVPAQSDCFVVIHGGHSGRPGKRFDITGDVVRIGRGQQNDIVLEDDVVSRSHARVERRGTGWVIMDVGSRNGTLVNEQWVMDIIPIRNGDRIRFGSVILKYLSGFDLETAYHEQLYQIAIQDGLTGLPNRRRFDDELATEFLRAKRHGRPLSLLLFDVDHFKNVNDRFGHPGGDAVLCNIGALLRARVRSGDLAARIGGEEFAIVMPETPSEGARTLAEELRATIATAPVKLRDDQVRVNVSVGCATRGADDRSAADLYGRCDAHLYRAKGLGRNRVVAEEGAPT